MVAAHCRWKGKDPVCRFCTFIQVLICFLPFPFLTPFKGDNRRPFVASRQPLFISFKFYNSCFFVLSYCSLLRHLLLFLLLLSTASCVFVSSDFLVVAVHGDGVLLATVVLTQCCGAGAVKKAVKPGSIRIRKTEKRGGSGATFTFDHIIN